MNYIDNNYRMPHDMSAEKQVLAMAFVNVQKINSVYTFVNFLLNRTINS